MAAYDNAHSRLVAWAKIVLPLIALAILSTLFLVSRTIDPNDAIPYADVDIEGLARDPRITAPAYAGLTSDGAALSVTAAEARPGDGQAARADTLVARLDTPDGGRMDIEAGSGVIDNTARQALLEGGVVITSSTGYRIETPALTAGLDETRVETTTGITGTGPLGDLTAGAMLLTADPAAPGQYVLVFKDRVKLVYDPAN